MEHLKNAAAPVSVKTTDTILVLLVCLNVLALSLSPIIQLDLKGFGVPLST